MYDSVSQLASSASTLWKEDKKISWVLKGVTYTACNTASSAAAAGTGPGLCPATEVGFVLTGKLSAPASQSGKSTEITACLNTDTGPNTSGSFAADVGAEVGGNTTIQIVTRHSTGRRARSCSPSAKAAFGNRPERSGERGTGLRPRPSLIPTLTPLELHP